MTELMPIERSITVRCPVEHAFAVFTERIGSWWPIAKYSIGEDRTVDVVFEPRVGGRLYERTRDGQESDWGTVLVFEPPRRLTWTWHPGRDPGEATEVEVRFLEQADGSTRVDLEHRGWERLGAGAEERRAGYAGDDAWPHVLGLFAEAV